MTATTPADPGATLIPLAGMYPLMTDAQRDGRACPWCNTEVTPETGVDLSERHLERMGDVIHPVACRSCTNQQARRAYARHGRTCVACAHGDRCDDSRLLRRLALVTRLTREEHC